MSKLKYASSPNYANAHSVLFSVNTQCAGTAPTFSSTSDRNVFSGDFIREVDNRLYSLPENFKSGNQLWDEGHFAIPEPILSEEIQLVCSKFGTLIKNNKKPICLGGDHIIKFAALKALDEILPGQFGVIYLDAHPDCEAQDELSYSSILHHGFLLPSLTPRQVMLMGIRQFTESEADSLAIYKPNIGIISGSEFAHANLETMTKKIIAQFAGLKYLYFSIDLDGLNPSCAPAVESPYPGGPSIDQVIYLIHRLRKHFNYIGIDICELIPKLDHNHITALSAARIIKEFYSVA
ncbi:formimidoylglutamase [Legionella wadsworthii]|uniref:Formimidoylglutamase n=1 Tax=Legionella wadsworthii TaxID=28088 RepID=A0A378LV45_9GAMM|nr:arginase family protein [Legionella wadsworthii]STY31366.1 formimidoylglutamase [Legionella wadsworthii]